SFTQSFTQLPCPIVRSLRFVGPPAPRRADRCAERELKHDFPRVALGAFRRLAEQLDPPAQMADGFRVSGPLHGELSRPVIVGDRLVGEATGLAVPSDLFGFARDELREPIDEHTRDPRVPGAPGFPKHPPTRS